MADVRRTIATAAAVLLAAGAVVAWRAWPRDDLCDVPRPVATPSVRLPAATPATRLSPPKPPSNAVYPLLYHAVHYPGGPLLGRLRWAVQTRGLPKDQFLGVQAGAGFVLAAVRWGPAFGVDHEIAGYRLTDGRLLWRLSDARLEAAYARGGTVVLERSKTTVKGDDRAVRWVHVGLDGQTGKVRWCVRDRHFLEPANYQPGARDRLVYEDGTRATLLDAANGRTIARIALPGDALDTDDPVNVSVGSDKLVVAYRNSLWAYRTADGHPLFHVGDLPHPPPRQGQLIGSNQGRVIIAPGRVVAESKVSDPDGRHERYLATAYDDAGREVWKLAGPGPGPGPGVVPRNPTVFGDATIVTRGLDAVEARRLSDGARLWRHPRVAGDAWTRPLAVGRAYLYGIDATEVTAIDRRTGAGTTIKMCCGELTEDNAIRGYSDALLTADRYTVAVFTLPANGG